MTETTSRATPPSTGEVAAPAAAGLTDAHPRLQAWYARLLERPAIQREL